MAPVSKSALVQAFLVDHREFMKLLYDVSKALKDGDVKRARTLAENLNSIGGPHIAFEEAVLYPALHDEGEARAFVDSLYDEHRAIVEALARLLGDVDLDEEALAELTAAFEAGLEHAEHCGTLISRLSALDASDQEEALAELKRFRVSGVKWTQLREGV